MVRRPAGRCRIDAIEPEVTEFQRIHEHIDRANRIALADPIIEAFRQQRALLAIPPLNETLHPFPPPIQQENHSIDGVFTQPGPIAELPVRRDEYVYARENALMLPGSGKALLFDIDGTLADTDALHLEAFNQILGPHGQVFDQARFSKELQGFSNASIRERFLGDEPPSRQAAIMAEKEAAFRKLVSGQIRPVAGLMTLLALADRASIPMVAVTNAP